MIDFDAERRRAPWHISEPDAGASVEEGPSDWAHISRGLCVYPQVAVYMGSTADNRALAERVRDLLNGEGA